VPNRLIALVIVTDGSRYASKDGKILTLMTRVVTLLLQQLQQRQDHDAIKQLDTPCMSDTGSTLIPQINFVSILITPRS
jgi:hypothetical protein